MTNIEILLAINSVLLFIGIVIIGVNYNYTRQRGFKDNVYKIKVETYQNIIGQCLDAWRQLDLNSMPFVEIYGSYDKAEWEKYYEKEIDKLTSLGFDIQKTICKETNLLPSEVISKVFAFSDRCIWFVLSAYHFELPLLVEHQQELQEFFFEVIDTFRNDLGTGLLDESLKSHIRKMKMSEPSFYYQPLKAVEVK